MKDNTRPMTIFFAVLALGGVLFGVDRCAAVRDLRAEAGRAAEAGRVAEAERIVLEWERHLYFPAGRDLSKTYGELENAVSQLSGVKHEDAWIWEARARLDMMQLDRAVAILDEHATSTREDAALLRVLAHVTRFQAARQQAQYAVGDTHVEKKLMAQLEPLKTAMEAAAAGRELRGALGDRLRGAAPGDYTVLLVQVGEQLKLRLGDEIKSAEELKAWQQNMRALIDATDAATAIQPGRPEAYTIRGLIRYWIVRKGGAMAEELLPLLDLALKDFERAKEKAQGLGLPMASYRCNVAGVQLAVAEMQTDPLDARSKLQSALENAGQVASEDATNGAALYILARGLHMSGGPLLPRAIAAYEGTLKNGNPDDVVTRLQYSGALNDAGYTLLDDVGTGPAAEEAALYFSRTLELMAPMLEKEPTAATPTIRRGAARLGAARALAILGKDADEAFKGALEDLDKVATARASDVGALYAAAEGHFWSGLYVAARDKVDPFTPLEPAVAAFTKVLEAEPKHAQSLLLRGLCRAKSAGFRKGEGKEFKPLVVAALIDVDAAIAADEKYVDAYLTRGQLHELDGNVQAAKEDYAKIADLAPARKAEMEARIKAMDGP